MSGTLPAKRVGAHMGLFTKDIKTMDDLFVHTLRDIYYAENKIVQSLPEMIENATDIQLKTDLESHLDETKRRRTTPRAGLSDAGDESNIPRLPGHRWHHRRSGGCYRRGG